MQKKYLVHLTEPERAHFHDVIRKLNGTSQKVRRGHILLKADADGPCWTDAQIAEVYHCRTKTVKNIRQRFVEEGFEQVLNGKKRAAPPTPPLLDGEQEARIIATRLGEPPAGYGQWSLRLLANRVVELGVVGSISHGKVRQVLKKRYDSASDCLLGDSA